jgi:chemotaxis protein histidine kinase CheA
MAKGQKDKTKKGSKKNDKKQGAEVKKYSFFPKQKLASYPNEDGVPFYLAKNQDEKAFFKLDNVVKTRDASNEEMFHRMGMALSLDSACYDFGTKKLLKHVDPMWPEDVKDQLAKSGLIGLAQILSSPGAGQKFLAAVNVLNVGQTGKPGSSERNTAIEDFVDFLKSDTENLQKHLARAASFSANIYLMTMTMMKDLALLENPKKWAAKMEKQTGKAVLAWIKKPKDMDKLKAALKEAFADKVKSHEKSKEKKKRASDSSSGGSSSAAKKSSASEKSSDSSSKDAKKKSKKKKASDSSSDEKDKKKDKDKKRKRSSSSSSEEKDKKKDKKSGEKKEAAKEKEAAKQKAKEKEEKEKKKTAAFTTFGQGAVQAFNANVFTLQQEIGNAADGTFGRNALLDLADQIPNEVLSYFAALQTTIQELRAHSEDKVSNTLARKVCGKLASLGTQIEEWYEENTGGDASAGSSVKKL